MMLGSASGSDEIQNQKQEGWQIYVKRRWKEMRELPNLPKDWVSGRWLLPLVSMEYRQSSTCPRSGERPKNPGRLRKMRTEAKKQKGTSKSLQQKEKKLLALRHEIQKQQDKHQAKLQRIDQQLQECREAAAEIQSKVDEKMQQLPKHMRAGVTTPKRRQKKSRPDSGAASSGSGAAPSGSGAAPSESGTVPSESGTVPPESGTAPCESCTPPS